MKKYFTDLLKSLGGSEYYKLASAESTSKGLVFNLKTSLVVGIVAGIAGIVFMLSAWPTIKSEALGFVEMYYPSELVMTFDDGTLTTNSKDPVYITSPEGKIGDNKRSNIIAIAANEKASVDLNEKYDALIVLAGDGLVGEKENETRVISYENFGNTVITKEFALESTTILARLFLKIGIFSAIPALIIFAIILIFIHMLWLLLVAVVIFLIFKVKKLPYTYKESYRIGLRAIAPLLIIELVALPFGFSGRVLSTIVILGIVLFATKDWKNSEPNTLTDVPPVTPQA